MAVDRENQATCCTEYGVCGVAIEAAAAFPPIRFFVTLEEETRVVGSKEKDKEIKRRHEIVHVLCRVHCNVHLWGIKMQYIQSV